MSAEPNRAPPAWQQRLNLENQRKRARSLLNAARARDAQALHRFVATHPQLPRDSLADDTSCLTLHHAQLVIAREQGFASWAKLKAHIVSSTHLSMPAAHRGGRPRARERAPPSRCSEIRSRARSRAMPA